MDYEKQKGQKPIISAEESLGISQEEYNEIVDECIYGEQREQEPSEQKYEDEKLHDIVIAELGKYNGENYWKAPWAMDSTGLRYPLYFATLGATWQKEQKPAGWSEEDEEMVLFWNMYYEHKVGNWPNKDVVEHLERFREWLNTRFKSLHPSWKPSEEQIRALEDAKMRMSLDGYGLCPLLQTLINDLKKL